MDNFKLNDIVSTYVPKGLIVFYENLFNERDTYVEYCDISKNGKPINAHPLSDDEADLLAKKLQTKVTKSKSFLKPKALLPQNVIYIDLTKNKTIWYSKPIIKKLYFSDNLEIKPLSIYVPPLVWSADDAQLHIYALKKSRKPTINTKLCYAPFMNVYKNGGVCMGTVKVNVSSSDCLEDFIKKWQDIFFNSYFSHFLHSENIMNGNVLNTYKKLHETKDNFPIELLNYTSLKIKDLI